ncbi:MAG: hypothetical protein J1E58_04980 [Prevotella sp.]|nr:hypothetical protein [Prevotella sp.]
MGRLRVTPWQNNNDFTTGFGKWYMKAFYDKTFDVTELSEHISKDSGVERTLVAAIMQAVMKQVGELLCNGHPIRVPHLGILKLGVKSAGAPTLEEFNARTHIKNLYILLVPDMEIKQAIREMKFVKYVPERKKPI